MNLPTGTIAKASAFFSSNPLTTGAGSSKPCEDRRGVQSDLTNVTNMPHKSREMIYRKKQREIQ